MSAKVNNPDRQLLFLLFFVSGFCGLLYQVIWTRMAFASFGIIAPVLSVVISVFMLGLSLGAWAAGRFVSRFTKGTGISAASIYGLAELCIGCGAFAVPKLFACGEKLLLASGQSNSAGYLALSALVLALSILPWCVLMGATFPLMMAYIKETESHAVESFSFLYLANVLGAMCGAILTAFVLVEVLGFRHTLWVAAAGNFLIGGISFWLGSKSRRKVAKSKPLVSASVEPSTRSRADPVSGVQSATSSGDRRILWILFATGFVAMAMEVVWMRAFAVVIKTQVYSFALVVATYLAATFFGSLLYRKHLNRRKQWPAALLLGGCSIAALLPIVINDPRFMKANWASDADPGSTLLLLFSICPFCALLGYLTPSLVDEYSAGSPKRAGAAYAVNVVGCVFGPLFASYLLMPRAGDRFALVLLALPLILSFLLMVQARIQASPPQKKARTRVRTLVAGITAMLAVTILLSSSYEDQIFKTQKNVQVRRDYAASVLSFGEGLDKHLLVNGIGMTSLTPITKFMVHLPLAFQNEKPSSVLLICFGMGTTYRSALSWGVEVTAVELVPSVKKAFPFYHADALQRMNDSNGTIVIDDGRRFLKRSKQKFDAIVVDPPPPAEAAGSSLLYSREFYEAAKERLKPGGILQAWVPGDAGDIGTAAARSVQESFPYVRCFGSVSDGWGFHLLASREPISIRTAAELIARMPAAAQRDLSEWSETENLQAFLNQVISREIGMDRMLNPNPEIQISDDRPYNEYFWLRRWCKQRWD